MGDGVDSDDRPHWTQWPWLWFLVGAAVLLIIGLIGVISFATLNYSEPGGKYVPPRMVDGEIVAGHFE